MNRARFHWTLGFLVVALVIGVTASVREIQQDLLRRGQAAIAAAEIPYYSLRIDGRDAVLAGFVAADTDIGRLAAVVGQVRGIRAVRNEVMVERLSPERGLAIPERSTTGVPELRAQRLGDVLIVTGSLPADGSVDALERALRSRFPAATLRIDVRADEAVGAREWTSSMGLLADALAELDGPSRLAAYGDIVQLSGQIAGPAERAELDALLARAPSVEWRLTLTQPSGSIGGAP